MKNLPIIALSLLLIAGALGGSYLHYRAGVTTVPLLSEEHAVTNEVAEVPDTMASTSEMVASTSSLQSTTTASNTDTLVVKVNTKTERITPEVTKPVPFATSTTMTPASCVAVLDTNKCLEDYYEDLVTSKGVVIAFTELKKSYELVPAVKGDCHQITHSMGHAAADLEGSVGKAFAIGDAMCWSGYYHGVMEEILESIGTTTLKSTINTICSDVPGKETYSFDYYNCIHGLGHGVMLLYDFNVFTSLAACDTLMGSWEQSSCGGGVFMENIMVESRGGKSAFLKPLDPVYPCNAVSELHKSQCYLMHTSHMLTTVGNDFAKVFQICSTVEESYQDSCYQSLGRDASGQSVSNIDRTVTTCNLAPGARALKNCVIGAVKDFISYHHSDAEALQLCERFASPIAESCRETTKSYYATF